MSIKNQVLNSAFLGSPDCPLPPVQAVHSVKLIDGQQLALDGLSKTALSRLQYDQERLFAKAIVDAPKDSRERALTIQHAYQTVCEILDEAAKRGGIRGSLSMGMDPRYAKLVLRILGGRRQRGLNDSLFEVGFGSGLLLQAATDAGHRVGGLEVAPQLFDVVFESLPVEHREQLLLGDFCSLDISDHLGRYGVVYWNDVMEHIATDEVDDYLVRIRQLLVKGGKLITITPNWHMRPSDVTANFLPPRTEAIGFHLKEYRMSEVRRALLNAGFSRVATPTYISRRRIWAPESIDMTCVKAMLEPLLEWLPFPVAVQCCRRFGFNLTIATN